MARVTPATPDIRKRMAIQKKMNIIAFISCSAVD